MGVERALPTLVCASANPDKVEAGTAVTFTVSVRNTSAEPVWLTSLTDSIYGDLDTQGDCSVPQILGVGGSYSCSITKEVSGNSGDTYSIECEKCHN